MMSVRDFLILAAVAVAGAVAPLVLPIYMVNILTEALIFGLFAMSLDLMIGFTKLESFGHAAAYGLGAYACALLLLSYDIPMLVAVILAMFITGAIAVPIAWICTRSTGVSFAMLTLAFAQLFYASVYQFKEFSGGSDGIAGGRSAIPEASSSGVSSRYAEFDFRRSASSRPPLRKMLLTRA